MDIWFSYTLVAHKSGDVGVTCKKGKFIVYAIFDLTVFHVVVSTEVLGFWSCTVIETGCVSYEGCFVGFIYYFEWRITIEFFCVYPPT